MKLLAILLTILIFGPSIWDFSFIAGLKVSVPTPVYPTRTYDPIRTLNTAGKVVLEGEQFRLQPNLPSPPTSLLRRPAITITKLHPHGTPELWSNVQHCRRIKSTWAIGQTSLVYVYLVLLVAVGSGLLQKHTIHHRNSGSKPAAASVLEPTGTPAHLSSRIVIDGRLVNVVLHEVSNYHPWGPHITRGFNLPWEFVEKSGQVNATVIVHRAAPTPATIVPTIANFGSEASAPLALIEVSNDVDESEQVTQETAVNSPPPSRPASPGFTSEHAAPITEAAAPFTPSTRFSPSYPDAIHSFNGSLGTKQYIAWLHLTRPAQPLPNRTVPADRAAVVRSHLRPTLRGLADRAGERHPPSTSSNYCAGVGGGPCHGRGSGVFRGRGSTGDLFDGRGLFRNQR